MLGKSEAQWAISPGLNQFAPPINGCEKWRQVPAEHAAAFPDEWRCADAEWASIACTDDEESWPAEGGGNDLTIHGQVQPVRGSKKRKESMHGTNGGGGKGKKGKK